MNIEFEKDGVKVSLKNMIDFINDRLYEGDKKDFPNLCENGPYCQLEVEVGRKFIRLVSVNRSQRSCYAFLDMQGNIYKSASWKAPAKHVRGTVFDPNYSWGKALGRYGAAYLR